jgi:hypothetical protein
MVQDYPGEIWKEVKMDYGNVIKPLLEVSNYGRVRTSNRLYTRKIIKGSMVNGYGIIRLKLYKEKDPETEAAFNKRRDEINAVFEQINKWKEENSKSPEELEELTKQAEKTKSKYLKDRRKEEISRTIYFQPLIHSLIAKYFCTKPSEAHTVIGHLDYNKLNNESRNLKWMTPEENYAHQRLSPYVISKKEEANGRSKLTVMKVMLLKKLLEEGKPIKMLAKSFKVTDTQIKRIMRGENWKDVEAAK